MKLYISFDMEGVPGTINWDHETKQPTTVKSSIHNHLTDIIEAIQASGKNREITEILIADSHNLGDNIDYDFCKIDPRIKLLSGCPRPQYMMPMLDSSFAMAFFIGYHAGTGALKSNMDHTYSNSRIQKISINKMPMNEALINAAYAGCKNVPLAFVSGDLALEKELKTEGACPWIEYVVTKEGFSKFAALNYNPLVLRSLIFEKINIALSMQNLPLFTFTAPIVLDIEFHSTAMADMACLMPMVKRIDGKSIRYESDDFEVLFDALEALISLAYSASI